MTLGVSPTLCAYCGGPFADAQVPAGQRATRYCCYGCRILGESKSVPAPSDGFSGNQPWWKVGLGAAIAGQAMVLGLALNLSQPEGSLRLIFHAGLAGSALLVLAVLGGPLFKSGWECACRRKIGVELLFLAGVVGAFGASLYSTLTGVGAVYYEVIAVLVTVYTAGKMLTACVRQRAVGAVASLRTAFARVRRVAPDGRVEDKPADTIVPGDCVKVFPAEPIPIDGIVQAGEAFVSETPLTGEPFPVVRRPGDSVFAGSFCEDGELLIRATRCGTGRLLDETLASVEQAQMSVAHTVAQSEADRMAAWFLPLVMILSVATLAVWGARGLWSEGVFHALALVLVACPCALGLVAPLSMWRAIASLASRGILIRDARAFEQLANAKTVVFDKTGTLSEERQTLVDFIAAPRFDREWAKRLVALVQRSSNHPVAKAFEAMAAAYGDSLKGQICSLKTVPAQGIEAWLIEPGGAEIHLKMGQRDWVMGESKAMTDDPFGGEFRLAAPGDRRIYVSIDGQIAGMAIVREKLRASALEAIARLKILGCQVAILTGDRHERALALFAGQAEIPIYAGLSAVEKKAWVIETRKSGGVVFVGDGVNDAPAITEADAGIALSSGAQLASQTASIVLAGEEISEVARLVGYSRQLAAGIKQSLVFAGVYNAVGMGLAAAGKLHPVAAALLMFASSATVSWRAVRGASLAHCENPIAPAASGLWKIFAAIAFMLQIPGLVYLGHLGWADGAAVGFLMLAGAWFCLRLPQTPVFGTTNRRAMVLAMLGPGNLGMLAGWFADAGGGRVMTGGVCLCCQSHHYFDLGWRIPWMHVGMLVAGNLAMWRLIPPTVQGGGRIAYLLISGAGMVGGMALGADCLLSLAGPMHPHQFIIAYVGMSLGMLLGMGLGCVLGETISDEWAQRRGRG